MELETHCPKEAAWAKPPQGWTWYACPGRLLAEESLRLALGETDWGLLRRDSRGFSLAFPWSPGGPFPLPSLFCLSWLEQLDGQQYILFRFSSRGWVELPDRSFLAK